MSKHFLHVNATPVSATSAAVRVVMQAPVVGAKLPFTASDGTVLTVVGSGRPFIGALGGKLVVGLRGENCPDAYRQEAVVGNVPNAQAAARSTRTAVAELRRSLIADEIETRKALHRMVSGIPLIGGC